MPISADLLTSLSTDAEKAGYLKNFRADSIGDVQYVMAMDINSHSIFCEHSEGL